MSLPGPPTQGIRRVPEAQTPKDRAKSAFCTEATAWKETVRGRAQGPVGQADGPRGEAAKAQASQRRWDLGRQGCLRSQSPRPGEARRLPRCTSGSLDAVGAGAEATLEGVSRDCRKRDRSWQGRGTWLRASLVNGDSQHTQGRDTAENHERSSCPHSHPPRSLTANPRHTLSSPGPCGWCLPIRVSPGPEPTAVKGDAPERWHHGPWGTHPRRTG